MVCTTRAWHPNIDLHTGLVSLPILTNDWRPVLSINTVVFALQLMFIEPTEHYPVNEPAATALKNNPGLFQEQVRAAGIVRVCVCVRVHSFTPFLLLCVVFAS